MNTIALTDNATLYQTYANIETNYESLYDPLY